MLTTTAKRKKYHIGIDEVGRGALAGPVTVAAVAMPKDLRFKNCDLGILRDSKKLSAKQREKWFNFIKNHSRINYAVASVSPKIIDRINISQAANLAAFRAFSKLLTSSHKINLMKWDFVRLDGGLSLPPEIPHRAFIRGDEKFNCVKLASIAAKVSRDRLMAKTLHKKYPQYGFDVHKGYGTKAHFAALKKHGHSKIHRLTFIGFLKNYQPKA